MPHRAKIKGTLLYDGSANPSISTTSDTLLAEADNKGGVSNTANTHGKNNVPFSNFTISQNQEKSNKNDKLKHFSCDKSAFSNGNKYSYGIDLIPYT